MPSNFFLFVMPNQHRICALHSFFSLWKKKEKTNSNWLSLFLLFVVFRCAFVSAVSLESTCFKDHTQFISHYFSAQSSPRALEEFFDCMDNSIQLFLNHTTTENHGYYTQTELRRFMQYMGARKEKAETMSKAFLQLKTGFIGGRQDRLTKKEIATFRKMLAIFRKRMRAMNKGTIPGIISILNNKLVPMEQFIMTTEVMTTHLISLGSQLSKLSVSADLSLLEHLPSHLQTLGFSNDNLLYWNRSLSLIKKWKKIFFSSPENIIPSSEWPDLLQSFGQLTILWLYHKRFLENQSWLNVNVIQHTQYFISYGLDLVRLAHKQSGEKDIFLTDIDALVSQLWFLPYLSRPVFRLSLRSTFCFLLHPLANKNVCKYKVDFQKANLQMSFSDMTFTITDTKEIYESPSGRLSDRIQKSHLTVLRQYLNSWMRTEQQIQTGQKPSSLFGSPHKWLNRNINVTSDNRLSFYTDRTGPIPLLSHLNWQSWLMKLITSSYTKRANKQVDQKLWNTMIKEWTAVAISIYQDMQRPRFQTLGFQMFKHGDFLTSRSNGDGILQEEEILELFSFFTSSLKITLDTLRESQSCKSTTYYVHADCIWDYLLQLPSTVFAGFPKLLESLSLDEKKKKSYIATISKFYSAQERLSIKDLFEIFLFIYYQENAMEYLDRDFSQYLTARELEPLLDVFEQKLIYDLLLINNKRGAYAFITYLFHFGEIPVFTDNNPISAPMRFSHWHLDPARWESEVQVDREDTLHTLLLINRQFQ
ncbi:MAG: hypothetical protein F4X95_02015 [Oligoflexia bacterium]|nr:hypothetical protein [Oligoflexia bacterium]